MSLEERIQMVGEAARGALAAAVTVDEIEAVRVRYLGRRGEVTQLLRTLGDVAPDARPVAGRLVNALKGTLSAEIAERLTTLRGSSAPPGPVADLTMPGRAMPRGHRHPITRVIEEICGIFQTLGFRVAEGPEVETDYYNFEALNIPADHPSRESFHTFYLTGPGTAGAAPSQSGRSAGRWLLRSQTSTVQIRVMEQQRPPVRIVAPGRVFRPDATDASHSFMFHQIEGLLVDDGVTFADLKGVLTLFSQRLFGDRATARFRPHFFPFTEPSAEMDVSCVLCQARGCRVCGGTGWIEILGAGMVHPAVLRAVRYDPERVTGFAFGMGVERIAMLRYGIDDIRLFFQNDLRMLEQW